VDSGNLCCNDRSDQGGKNICIPQGPLGHETPSQGGNSMPKNAKNMKLNPNRNPHSFLSEDVHSNKQTN
jgi:hypothetical protein